MKSNEKEKAFIELIKLHERIIYKVCSFYASDTNPIADLYQEVVCNLWSAFPKFRNECSPSTWIYRIALNTCISDLRKLKRSPKAVPLSQQLQELLPNPAEMTDDIKELYQLVHRLKTIERAIILLYLEERSYQEIADITGLALSNVATKIRRTKEKLKQMSNL